MIHPSRDLYSLWLFQNNCVYVIAEIHQNIQEVDTDYLNVHEQVYMLLHVLYVL